MKYEFVELEKDVTACLIYIDNYDDNLKQFIDKNFLEIVSGKMVAERASYDDDPDTFKDAAKYIINKKGEKDRVGIIAEFLFHCMMRLDIVSSKFLSCSPTIAYSDSYQGFFKGFDGCYYNQDEIWIAEVKSKMKTENLDKDNKDKLLLASSQLEDEVNDEEINRWENTKKYVHIQLSREEIDEKNLYKILNKKSKTNYNKILGTMLICNENEFNKEYIKSYLEKLKDKNVDNQKIFLMCIRNYDYKELYNYILDKYGD